jgi:hypothetical protein
LKDRGPTPLISFVLWNAWAKTAKNYYSLHWPRSGLPPNAAKKRGTSYNLEPATPFCLHCSPFLLFHPLLRRLSPPLCARALSYSGVIGQFSRNLPRTVRASAALISTTVRRLKPVRYQQYLATPGPEKEIFMSPSDLTGTAFLDESIRHLTILYAKTDISTNSHP